MLKYKLSFGAIFNNEESSLKEWLDHHIRRGVEHFYLIDDNSTDNFLNVLEPYKELITLFSINERKQFWGRQSHYYNQFFINKLKETEWFLICDIDEYVWSPKFLDLREACNHLEQSQIFSLAIPMVLFGSNNQVKQPKSIVEGFIKRSTMNKDYLNYIDDTCQYKSIMKSSTIQKFQIHVHEVSCETIFQNSLNLNLDLFRLNHYRLQSEEKWKNNLKKFDVNDYKPETNSSTNFQAIGNTNKMGNNYRTMDLFYQANKTQNEVDDLDLVIQNQKYAL
jgi:hypothetical protein